MRQLNIPQAAEDDENSIEIISVWVADNEIYCSIRMGAENVAWGLILADTARHISDALSKRYNRSTSAALDEIVEQFLTELGSPTSPASGDFA